MNLAGGYGSGLAQTGVATLTVGGVAIARPLLALGVAAALLVAGVTLRVTGRRRKLKGTTV